MSREHKLIFVGDTKKLQYIGGGIDDKKDYPINCQQGDTIYVTEEKKAELLKDHGNWFVIDLDLPKTDPNLPEQPPAKTSQSPKPEAIIEPEVDCEISDEPAEIVTWEDMESDFESMTNAELRELAGTDNKRLSKKKLIEMIESKSKE